MRRFAWSDDLPVIGKLPFEDVMQVLRDMGDMEEAADLEQTYNRAFSEQGVLGETEKGYEWWRFWDRPWSHTGHTLGYLAPADPASEVQPLQHASAVVPDDTLKNARVKITLDNFYVAAYPGLGTHSILLQFYIHNQVKDKGEHLYFNLLCSARDGDHATVHGAPLFQGLNVGLEGIVLGVYAVNIQSSGDEKLLSFLKGDLFKEGLKLLTTIQPATALFSSAMHHLTTQVAQHYKSKVLELKLGLDFSKITSRYQLKEGSYIAVQLRERDPNIWMWDEWVYQKKSGLVVSKANMKRRIPHNYFIFSISRYINP